MKRLLLALALTCPFVLVSCGHATAVTPAPPQDPYLRVATAIKDIQKSDKEFAATVVKANAQMLLSDSTTRTLLDVALKISQGGDQAAAVLQGLTSLPPGTKVTVWNAISPITKAVNDSLATGLISIKDANTKTAVQAILTSIQTALAVVQVQTGGQ